MIQMSRISPTIGAVCFFFLSLLHKIHSIKKKKKEHLFLVLIIVASSKFTSLATKSAKLQVTILLPLETRDDSNETL